MQGTRVNFSLNYCKDTTNKKCSKYINISIIILILYFLFDSGFIYTIAEDENAISFPLGINNLDKYGNKEKANFYDVLNLEQDVFSAKWVSKNVNYEQQEVYADDISKYHALLYSMIPHQNILKMTNTTKLRQKSYVYLRYSNIAHGIMTNYDSRYNYTDIYPLINKSSEIYSNAASKFYYYE